jgi:hypothetical protein
MTDAGPDQSARLAPLDGAEDDELVAGSSWLLWWKIGAQDLRRQVSGYHTLDVFRSIRGLSGIFLLVGIVFTIFDQMARDRTPSLPVAITIGLMAILAIFTLLGYRWAMICDMLIVSLDKLGGITGVFLTSRGGALVFHFSLASLIGVLIRILWWCICMHAFYFAFRVEREMARMRRFDPAVFE